MSEIQGSRQSTGGTDATTTSGRTGRRSVGPGRSNRRSYLVGASALFGAALAGCAGSAREGSGGGDSSGQAMSQAESYEPVVFIETPGNQPENTRKQWQPFVDYLVETVDGLEMDIQFAQNYSAVGTALKSGQAHMSLADVVLLADPEAFDVLAIQSSAGTSVYFSFVCTLPSYEGIEELTDLKGKTIAFADPLSTSGSLFATYALQQAGLDVGDAPYGDPVDYRGEWSNHDSAKRSLFNREDVVACGTYGGNIMDHFPREEVPEIVRERSSEWDDTVGTKTPAVEMLHHSEPIPKSPLIAPSEWEHPLRAEMEEAILAIEEGTLRKPEGVELPITAMKAGSVEDYQPVQNVIDSLGVELGDL